MKRPLVVTMYVDGFPWAEFLAIRAKLIDYFIDEEHKSSEEVARILSCDPEQVRLIHDRRRPL